MGAELILSDRLPTATARGWTAADREVSDAVRDALLATPPGNTIRAYGRWNRDFTEWCDAVGRVDLPASPETLTEYVFTLREHGKGVPSLRQAIAAIRSRHKLAGWLGEPNAAAARLLVRGHARDQAKLGVRPRQAPPILIDDLRAMAAVCDPHSLRGTRDRLILCVGWGTLLRRSEISALHYGDVRPNTIPANGTDVFIAASKTDKDAKGALRTIASGSHPDSDVSSMLSAYRHARARAGLHPSGPLFRSLHIGGRIGERMTEDAINDLVKELARKAGLSHWSAYSAHSLRAGGATGMFLRGQIAGEKPVLIDEIVTHGRWAPGSTVVMGYIRAAQQAKHNPMAGVM